MLNTPKSKVNSKLIQKEEELILSLEKQPLIVVIRIENTKFSIDKRKGQILILIDQLANYGVKHIEIAWSKSSDWHEIIKYIQKNYPTITLGAASITTEIALDEVIKLKLPYAMSPFWDKNLQIKAKKYSQILIPGVFSPSEIYKAMSYGCRIIKLFPASTLGINYIEQLRIPIGKLPFIIAAGGLQLCDLEKWLNAGHGAITLGRSFIKDNKLDPSLKLWISANNEKE